MDPVQKIQSTTLINAFADGRPPFCIRLCVTLKLVVLCSLNSPFNRHDRLNGEHVVYRLHLLIGADNRLIEGRTI
jgi:hypothetical protein